MTSDIRELTLNCERCGKSHNVKIDYATLTKGQLAGREPVISNFMCPDVAYMYRVMGFVLDTRVNILKNPAMNSHQLQIKKQLQSEWGARDFDKKLDRFINLNLAFIGIPEEYYNLLWTVTSTYCSGYFYPAMTSAGSLGERILNRLILKTRGYFTSSEHYKKIWNKKSFDQWDKVIEILEDWQIISKEVSELFNKLKKYRNDSIHYNDDYDFELNSHDAVKTLAEIINKHFNYHNRTDLFWVYNIPGEIWVKSEKINDPFVKEFVLPHCLQLTPFCEPSANPPIQGKHTPLKPLTDEEFISIRNDRNNEKK